jgi:hypothetical protein
MLQTYLSTSYCSLRYLYCMLNGKMTVTNWGECQGKWTHSVSRHLSGVWLMEPIKANKTPREQGRSGHGASSKSVDYKAKTLNQSTTTLISERLTGDFNWDFGRKCSWKKYTLCIAHDDCSLRGKHNNFINVICCKTTLNKSTEGLQ